MHLLTANNASSLPRTLRIFIEIHINLYYPHTHTLILHTCTSKSKFTHKVSILGTGF